jgi:integrase
MSVWESKEKRETEIDNIQNHIHTLTHSVQCSECGSDRLYRNGLRYLSDGSAVQRWLCRNCGYRFSEKPLQNNPNWSLNSPIALHSNRQICVLETKNLDEALEIKNPSAGRDSTSQQDAKGKIVALLWQLKNDGRQPSTLCNYRKYLIRLLNEGADLFNPERTKEVLAQATLKDNTKRTVVGILETWFQFNEIKWKAPKYSRNPEIPYIPSEQELDQLIAACGKKISTYLQVLKETGARCGEISSLKWTSIDPQQKNVRIKPEKGSNPRILPLSQKALDMLNNMPKTSERIFANADDMRTNFFIQRRRIAKKLANPRLLEIHFHTLRHWKATMEQHKTKDPWHVKQILGHKSIHSTEAYIHLEQMLFQTGANDEFHVKVANTPEEITGLLETGFEYIMTKGELAFFRKRK